MGVVQIITDSTCTLPPDVSERVRQHVRFLRTSVQFKDESWVEGTFTLDQFYQRVTQSSVLPTSSQPSPTEYWQAFQDAAPHGPILGIFLSAVLSSTYDAAVTIGKQVTQADVVCFDSHYFSSPLGYMVAEAAEMALNGASRCEIITRLQWRRERSTIFIAIDTLDFLRRSGRVNFFQAGLATMLNLKPILTVKGGHLTVVERVRSRRRSLTRLLTLLEEQVSTISAPLWISAMHGNAEEEATWLLSEMAKRFPVERQFISDVPASVALHGGPGVVGVMATTGEAVA